MLRRQARLRREYFYKRVSDIHSKKTVHTKQSIGRSITLNAKVHGDHQKDAVVLSKKLAYNVENSNAEIDDEYTFAENEDPKIMITTSHDPSARLKLFAKELRLLLPNAQRINRGKYEVKQLMLACRAHNVSDLIIVHEHRGIPDNLIICHLPYGPTAFFNISGVIMRHDIPDIGPMSEQKPHLIFHNFKTKLGGRVVNILKHLYPVPKADSKRVITFANNEDRISFRHHTYQKNNKNIEIKEIGPRFNLKLYQIKLGTLDEIDAANTEWVYRPFMNTTSKTAILSDENGFEHTFQNN